MRHHLATPALIAALSLAPFASAPVQAQEPTQESESTSPSLMERGAELFWEGLRQEMAPSLQELEELMTTIGPSMQSFLQEMGPALAEIAGNVEDWSRYELPEILPNGDIIIRRKPDAPDAPDATPRDKTSPPDTGTDL